MGKWVTVFLAAALASLAVAVAAGADRATIGQTDPHPWAGGASEVTPLEALLGKIAARIGGHPVSVLCDTAADFRSRGQSDAAGYVWVSTDRAAQRFSDTASEIHLAAPTCGALSAFASATTKPTRCASPTGALVPCFVGTPAARGSAGSYVCSEGHCFAVVKYWRGYWSAYDRYSQALLTLAHEAIHIRQAQRGAPVPSRVEVDADCYGMQWMTWVAVQLGAAWNDAQRIAQYFWLVDYPREAQLRTALPYWSADCRPGGKLDIRAAGSTVWP